MDELIASIREEAYRTLDIPVLEDLIEAVKESNENFRILPEIRTLTQTRINRSESSEEVSSCLGILFDSYCYGAKRSFDDYMIACEWDREPQSKFWLPRRGVLEGKHKIATQIQEFIEDDNALHLGISMPPGTGKTTLIKFLLSYIYGQFPKSSNMYVSYSDAIVKMMYDSVSGIITDDYEYRFGKIFPDVPKPTLSAEYYTISARNKGDFPTLGLISLGGSITGRTRANKLLVTDDLVKNKEMARSPMRLDMLYDDYKSTVTTRSIGDTVKQIQLGTIWSVHDPLSRMASDHEGDERYKFIRIPVKDEEGHSNFLYEHPDRYNDERIANLESSLDPVDFSCLYMQQGMEKEGLAFPSDSLLYYNGELPDGEADRITLWCDVAFGGGDSLSMPIAYIYDGAVYIHDVVFDRGDKKVTQPMVVDRIIRNKVRTGGFEADSGGEFYAQEVEKRLKTLGYRMNIQTEHASRKSSKADRIEQYAPTIKEWYFIDKEHRTKEYQKFMDELCSYSFSQKNIHDDAADSLAGLAARLNLGTAKVTAVRRSF